MTDWTSGYVADIGYTYGYYSELNPQRVVPAFLNAGLAVPEFSSACELGFGQGMSVNMHAAASGVQWHGTDFNPSQAAFARQLAAVSGSGAHVVDEAFADFCNRPDLPDFDFIGLHGIWSWISDANRAVIVDFVRRKLKVGGVLYVSYNVQPGWAAMVPMRHLLTEHLQTMSAPGQGMVPRIDSALNFADQLLALNPQYARVNPGVTERFKKIREQNRNYLAHEYFNKDWLPMPFSSMAGWLQAAKVNYACSASYIEHIDMMSMTAEQSAFLKQIPDPVFRETVRDYMTNQQFRRDYWVKGPRKISGVEQVEGWRNQRLLLDVARANVAMKTQAVAGEILLQEAIYAPILDVLADHKVHEFKALEAAAKTKGINFAQLAQAILLLLGRGDLALVQDDRAQAKARPRCDKLNAHLMSLSRTSSEVSYLSSPVMGGAISVPRFHQLFMLARSGGSKTPADMAAIVWQVLATQGQKLVHEGKTIETPEENLKILTMQAKEFTENRLPVLRALGIAG